VFRAKLGHMKLHPRVTKTAVELVKRFEGLRRRAARLPDGGWTIGYGHTLTAREGVEVTPEEAELLLYYDLSEVATRIDAWTFTPLTQNQFEALTAFAFNIGIENFRRSTVLKRINEGQHLQAAAAMELWRKTEVGGEGLVADALVRRRAAEKAHYLTPPEGFQPSPSQVLRPIFDYSVIEAAAQSHTAQRAQVVDAPLDGDHATASVEHPAEPEPIKAAVPEAVTPEVAAPEPEVSKPDSPRPPPGIVPILDIAATAPIAAAIATPILRAPEPAAEPDALPAFRGFEPPPRRFGRADEAPPPAANEHLADFPGNDFTTQELSAAEAAEHPGDFNLFDRPLAPPEPPRPFDVQPVSGPALVMGDNEVLQTVGVHRPAGAPSILQDRTVLFSAIGLLGVALFTLAIFTMLVGKATLWHLLIGFLGVVLITPAGVFFLMRRMGESPAPGHDDRA